MQWVRNDTPRSLKRVKFSKEDSDRVRQLDRFRERQADRRLAWKSIDWEGIKGRLEAKRKGKG